MAKMPSEQTRLDRIARNYKKLPKKQAQNIKKSESCRRSKSARPA
jgi:hypothetical protein